MQKTSCTQRATMSLLTVFRKGHLLDAIDLAGFSRERHYLTLNASSEERSSLISQRLRATRQNAVAFACLSSLFLLSRLSLDNLPLSLPISSSPSVSRTSSVFRPYRSVSVQPLPSFLSHTHLHPPPSPRVLSSLLPSTPTRRPPFPLPPPSPPTISSLLYLTAAAAATTTTAASFTLGGLVHRCTS